VPDRDRFETFLRALPDEVVTRDGASQALQHVVEFRDARAYDDGLLDLLRRYRVALCLHDMPGSGPSREITASHVYVRFHGQNGSYGGGYPKEVLEDWASWLANVFRKGTDVFAYFNNDAAGHAPRDALTLRSLLASKLVLKAPLKAAPYARQS
jgi:uncharacterized protein YecE (DUF72 family)